MEIFRFHAAETLKGRLVVLVQWQSHGPEVTDGDLIDHRLRRRALQTLHRILHSLLGFHQILHL